MPKKAQASTQMSTGPLGVSRIQPHHLHALEPDLCSGGTDGNQSETSRTTVPGLITRRS